ncbi:Vacuolar protein sorting-associated protein ist1 [Cladochytrium tenue]|nr:Vacuolar protein sorting-associated protein ist1 [Cladochytrium tenue]
MAFNPSKCKVQLRLAVTRLRLLQQKKTATSQAARREIAQLLEKGKLESAKVRTENIIREDFTVEALEILELYCETLLARFGLLEQMRYCDQSIAEAVNTIIYAAPRCEVKELGQVQAQLFAKFGKDFGMAALANENDVVNSRLVHKLRIQAPDPLLIDQYLVTIARAYNAPYESEVVTVQDLDAASLIDPLFDGASAAPVPASTGAASDLLSFTADAPPPLVAPKTSDAAAPPPPGPQAATASHNFPAVPAAKPAAPAPSAAAAGGGAPDFDELTRRFEALKRRK